MQEDNRIHSESLNIWQRQGLDREAANYNQKLAQQVDPGQCESKMLVYTSLLWKYSVAII